MKWRGLLLTGLVTFGLSAGVARASEGFETNVQAEYTINPGQPTKVNLEYSLVNSNAAVFVQNYQVILPGNNLGGLVVQQKDQTITKDQHADHDRQILDLSFENEVVGQGKRRDFAIEYTDQDLLQSRGGSSLVRIRPLPGSEDFDSYRTIVRLPASLGTPDEILPEPVKTGTGSGQLVYTFDQSTGETITIGYGDHQVLQFGLAQTLTNGSNTPAYRELTLPGDRDEVQFVYSGIYPEPTAWSTNTDGSWQAIYLLGVGETINVDATGYLIYHSIDRDFQIHQYYPVLDGVFHTYNLTTVPEELTRAIPVNISVENQVVTYGLLPWLDRYQLGVRNHTGQTITGLQLRLSDPTGTVGVTPEQQELALYPWQLSSARFWVHGDWYRPYTLFTLQLQISDQQGNLIHEQQISGLTLSYAAFGAVGAILGLAAVAGSVLVARRRR